jgi:signal transduction histidine kinase
VSFDLPTNVPCPSTSLGDLDEQRVLLERLEQRVQGMVEAAQQTAHDLNRPLTSLRLMMAALDKGTFGPVGEPVRKVVQTGLQAVRQMERLVRDLIDSSRLDHDGVQLEFVDCDLGAVVAEVLQLLRFEVTERSAQVAVDPLPVVRADPWALTKVFTNLLGNALNYAKPGQSAAVHIRAEETANTWRVLVADAGIGIPMADRSRLFRRFERGSNTGGIGGTGLGLHIVRELMHRHGGEVTFESAEGVGTTFRIELPKAPVRAPQSPTRSVALAGDR